MKRPGIWCLFAFVILGSPGAGLTRAEERKGNPEAEAAIGKNAELFIEAFHRGDAGALAAFWTEDGDYTDLTGKTLKGRKAIEKAFTEHFAANKGLKLRIDSLALRFVTPDVAIEDGVTTVMTPDEAPPSRARYTIVHVKKDGKWQISSVRDAAYAAPGNHEQLRGLDGLVGDWAEEKDKGETARVSYSWAEGEGFLTSSFTTTFKELAIGGGSQMIGWDPVAKQIRSWNFENGGGFGEGTWTRDGNKWIVKSTGVLRDGKKLTATNIITLVDADTLSWQAKERTVDGKAVPDSPELKLKRVK